MSGKATVYHGGRIFTSDPARPRADALSVLHGRILAVGSDAEVREATGGGADLVDLGGRMLCAGFQDAHVHPTSAGLTLLGCDLTHDTSLEAGLESIRRYASAHPDDPWVVGDGWRFDWFERGTPDAELLDRLIPDRPAYLEVADGHAGWANSLALERAGIDASTPDPIDGRIERRPDGSPQGTVQEGAMALIERVLPPVTDERRLEGLLRAQEYLFQYGVTAWQDAHIGEADHASYRRAEAAGSLRAHVRGAAWWERDGGTEQLELFESQRADATGRYGVGSVKFMLDGVVENHTAAMLRPFLDGTGGATGNLGIDMLDPGALPGFVTAVAAAGFQPHFHAIGDRAVRNALDAVATMREALGERDLRPHIAHIQVIDPDDIPRFAALGVIANAQPLWACADPSMVDLTLPFLDERAATNQYPFGSLLRSGARLAMGSDWAVSTPNVMMQIQGAVDRTIFYFPDAPPFLPDEGITLHDALVAFTAGSAHANFLEGERGVLRPGMAADLVVLDRDPFEAEVLGDVKVDMTMIDGEVVFSR